MLRYKYIHIMLHESSHNLSVIEMINNNPEFNSNEHLFVILYKSLFDMCYKYKNIILDERVLDKDMRNFTKYLDSCDYVFLHCHRLSTKHMLKLNSRRMSKMIWCVWGHDLYNFNWEPYSQNESIGEKIQRLLRNLNIKLHEIAWNYKTKKMYGVGIGFKYDALEIKRKFGDNLRVLSTPYGYRKDNIDIISNIIKKENQNNLNRPYKIMIGHSGYSFLNHIEIIKKLEKFRNEQIMLSFVFAYGDTAYIREVESFAIQTFGDKVEFIKESLSFDRYVEYLSSVDACVLDYRHQSALGNIYLLLYMNKKLFLNKYGIIKTALLLEGIQTNNVSDLDKMTYEELVKPLRMNNNGMLFSEKVLDENSLIEMWQNTLRELD